MRVSDRLVTRSAALVSVAVLCTSCEQAPLLAPTASTVTLVANRSVLPLDGATPITATVLELGGTAAHDGTLVTFSTTLGSLEPTQAHTRNGQAAVTLRAGPQSGVAEVSAFSGGARSEPVTVTIGAAAAAGLTVTASSGTVPAAGGAVTIAARPADAAGNALPGVPVAFTADAGALSVSTALSDARGEARTTLTTDRDTVVTASVNEHTASVTIRVNLAPTVTVAATGPQPAAGEPTPFTVTVTAGSSAVRAVTIDFGDGTVQSLGPLVGSTDVTHTYQAAGTFNVVATAADTAGEEVSVATVIVVQEAVPLNVTVTASPAAAQVGDLVVFTATATQPSGTPAIDRYEWDFGDGGRAATTGNTTSHVYDRSGRRVVSVLAVDRGGRTGEGRTEIDVSPRPPLNVTLTADPPQAMVGDVVVFTATVSGSTVPIARYEWDFGDSERVVTTGNAVNHVYETAGTRTAAVLAVDRDGRTAAGRTEVAVVPRPPLNVNLTADPPRAAVGDVVAFTATVSGSTAPIERYEWDFGDDARVTTSGNAVSHVYEAAGTRVATVRAMDRDGQTGVGRTTVEVTPRAPLNVNLTANPPQAAVGDTVVFTATVSGSTVPVARYEWDFGDDVQVTTNGNVVNHVYEAAGTHAATVRAVDRDGRVADGQATVEVTPRAPLNVNLMANPPRAAVGDVVVFTATVGGSTIPVARYEWDFGDGVQVTTNGNVVNHVYEAAGTHAATVRAVDRDGRTAGGQTTVEVTPRAPLNVNLTANPPRVAVGDVVVFTATVGGSTVPVERYEWDFGDGVRVTTTGNTVSHVYEAAGTRVATVRAVDRDGRTGDGRTTVEVTLRASLNVNLTANPPQAEVGEIVVFTARVSGSTVPVARYEWDFGDGAQVTTTGNVVNHVYETAGTHTAQVAVFSIEDDRGTSRTTVIVTPQ